MQLQLSKWLYKYFSLNGYVTIPGLGNLSLIRVPSTNDFANKLFYPPMYRYRFEYAPDTMDEALLSYLQTNLDLTEEQLQQSLSEFSREINNSLKKLGKIDWEGVGSFQLNNDEVVFAASKNDTAYLGEIKYEHVVRETYSHDVLTGDRVQSSEDLQAYFEEQKSRKIGEKWKIFSIITLMISIALLVMRFMMGNFSLFDSRYNRVIPTEAESTYSLNKSF